MNVIKFEGLHMKLKFLICNENFIIFIDFLHIGGTLMSLYKN